MFIHQTFEFFSVYNFYISSNPHSWKCSNTSLNLIILPAWLHERGESIMSPYNSPFNKVRQDIRAKSHILQLQLFILHFLHLIHCKLQKENSWKYIRILRKILDDKGICSLKADADPFGRSVRSKPMTSHFQCCKLGQSFHELWTDIYWPELNARPETPRLLLTLVTYGRTQ